MMKRAFVLAGAVLFIALGAGGANAATLNVVGGQLLSASGVEVDGGFYDVEFVDGTCAALYSGCDSISDFHFNSEASAILASQALLDQVFLDGGLGLFDTTPALTSGCAGPPFVSCALRTPFGLTLYAGETLAMYRGTQNHVDEISDMINTGSVVPTSDTSDNNLTGWAVWTPVPEPGTALLVGLGLIAAERPQSPQSLTRTDYRLD